MPLGLAERATGLVTGLGQAAWQVPGLLVDLATMRVDDEEEWGRWRDLIAARTIERSSTALDEAFRGGTGLSALTHETPLGSGLEDVRSGVGSAGERLLSGADRFDQEIGGEFIREPLSALLLAGSLSTSEEFGGDMGLGSLAKLTERETWSTARDMAEDISFGQAFWLMFTRDILDPEESAEFRDSTLFQYASGTVDSLLRFAADPDVLAAKAFRAGRLKYWVRDVRTPSGQVADPGRIDAYFRSDRWRKHNDFLDELSGERPNLNDRIHRIADEFFPDDGWRLQKATVLARAPDAASRELVLRGMMGDMRAVERLERTADQLRSVRSNFEEIKQVQAVGTPTRLTESGSRLADQLDHAALELRRTQLDEGIVSAHLSPNQRYNAITEVLNDPTNLDSIDAAIRDTTRLLGDTSLSTDLVATQTRELRRRILRGQVPDTAIYQTSQHDTPLRVVNSGWWKAKASDKRVHPLVDVNDPNAPEMGDRMLRAAGMPESHRAQWIERLASESSETGGRAHVWNMMVEDGLRHIGNDLGIDRNVMTKILGRASSGRQRAHRLIERAYATGRRDLMPIEDPVHGRFMVALPMTKSQRPNTLTAPDFQRIRQDLRRAQKRGWLPKAGAQVKDISDSVLDTVTWHWKANVLLRVAWPIRVTGLDEMMRMIAKFGVATTAMETARGVRNIIPAYMQELGLTTPRKIGTTGAAAGGLAGLLAAGPAGAAVGGTLGSLAGSRILRNLRKIEDEGFDQLTRGLRIGGHNVPAAFGEPGDVAEMYYRKVSSGAQLESFMVAEHQQMRRLQRDPAKTRTIVPEDANHEFEWLRVLNRQWRNDPLARRILEGQDVDELKRWLGTPEGREYKRALPTLRTRDEDAWLENLSDYVLETTVNPQLRSRLLQRSLKGRDLAELVPDPMARPAIHGAAIDDSLGQSAFMQALGNFIEKGMRTLGTMPTDYLVRQRSFEVFYRQHMERLIGGRRNLTQADIDKLAHRARDRALSDVRDLSYDLAERREIHHMLRNFIPFLAATQEVATTWAKVGIERPDFAVRAVKAWTGVDQWDDITYHDPDTNETYLTFPIPDFARKIVNHSSIFRHAFDDTGRIRLPKTGFNLILQSPLGFGPIIQASASAIVRSKPEAEEVLSFALPFGASESTVDAFMAAWQRRLVGLVKGRDDDQYASAWNRTLQTRLAKMRQGELEEIDFDNPDEVDALMNDVTRRTNASYGIGLIASFAAPATPIFDSPYWPYIDAYRALQEADPDHALETFIDQFGEELADVTTAITRSNDGIPPTMGGLELRKEFADIIERYPELGGFIAGTDTDVMSSKFSRAVYDYQRNTPVAPGSGEMQREPFSPRERAEQPDIRLGWIKYSRLMDWVEAERISRGLPNLLVKEAQDLAEMRRRGVELIAEEHPAWARERETFDTASFQRRLEGFRLIADEPALAGRPEVQAVKLYLEARDAMTAELRRREAMGGSANLYTRANADLEHMWQGVVASLIEQHPAFGPVYYRWFERDPMEADTDEEAG